MRAFHIDFNMAMFQVEYLKKFFSELKDTGYDTLLWELEGLVKWESCPEAAAEDAISKAQFKRELLDHAAKLGFVNVPLLQTLGHCEYVLRSPKYAAFRELPDKTAPYCPNAPGFREFIGSWIEEICDTFAGTPCFHLGCDEAFGLGTSCPRCAATPVPQLIIDHVIFCSGILQKRGIRPMIWADMLLRHPEYMDKLPKSVITVDWMYDIFDGCNQIFNWNNLKLYSGWEALPEDLTSAYRKYLWPDGDELKVPEICYTTAFLKDHGFEVVSAPGTSHQGDNLVLGRNPLHVRNVAAMLKRNPDNYIVTSWTLHLHTYDVQSAIYYPKYHSPEEFFREFPCDRYHVDAAKFWQMEKALAAVSLFTSARNDGHRKDLRSIPAGHWLSKIADLKTQKRLNAEISNAKEALEHYKKGKALAEELLSGNPAHREELELRLLAARWLVNRAGIVLLLTDNGGDAAELKRELAELRGIYSKYYHRVMYPVRAEELVGILFNGAEEALQSLP